MDLTELDPQRLIYGLAVLAAIPVVLFALWAEYYHRYLQIARKTHPGYDPKLERDRIRVAGGCVLVFEALLFLASLNIADSFPKISIAVTFGSVLCVGFIQAQLEKDLQTQQLTPAPAEERKIGTGIRALLFGLMSGFLYVATLMVFVKAAAWFASAHHFSPLLGACFVMGAAAVGVLCGITINFALAPWQLKNTLKMTAMSPEEIASIKDPMEQAGLSEFEYWIVEESHATAAIAGFRKGRGVFRPAIFISRKMMKALTQAELKAVVAHEAAHVLAQHLKKRILLAAFLVTSLTFIAVFFTVAAVVWMPGANAQGSLGLFFGFAGFTMAYFIIQKQSRVHEFQADWLAIQKLGADFESWSSALRKMDQMNGIPSLRGSVSSHPRTEARIQNVAKMLEFVTTLRKAESRPDSKSDSNSKKDAA